MGLRRVGAATARLRFAKRYSRKALPSQSATFASAAFAKRYSRKRYLRKALLAQALPSQSAAVAKSNSHRRRLGYAPAIMRVHHLRCGSFCPLFERWLQGTGRIFGRADLPCHCLLIETDQSGLVLVDTGLGVEDLNDPVKRLGPVRHVMSPVRDASQTAVRQIEALGFDRSDVRHIVLTHMDFDHAGGLSDFPDAVVHLMADEKLAAVEPPTRAERFRYRAVQWNHDPIWQPHVISGERWRGFECVRDLPGLPPEILMMPLAGHTRGHSGVAVGVGDQWLVHAGDAYFHHEEMAANPKCPPGTAFYQRLIAFDNDQRLANQHRLRELVTSHTDIRVFCAHDPTELRQLQLGSDA